MKTSIPKLHSIKWKNGSLAPNVIPISNLTAHDIPVDNVLKGAYEAQLQDVALIGHTPDGKEYIATSTGRIDRAAYMFSRGHFDMMQRGNE